jgi:hypothetical protein
MRRLLNLFLAIAALLIAAHSAIPVRAQGSAYNTNFITSITYQNVGTATANITFTFYPTSGSPISFNRTLAANAGASLNVGQASELSGFSGQGSAVISSDQPIVATIVQIPQSTSVRNRPLSNGFGSNDGSNNVLIATVLKNKFNPPQTTKFSIQNADSTSVDVTLRFFEVGSATPIYTDTFSLNVGTARFFDAGTIGGLGTSFNGSAVIQASGKVVATAIEASTNSPKVSAFEGVAQGSNTIYMPSALCDFGGTTQQRTAYAVQNTSTSNSATVTVTYKDLTNNTVATQTATIPAGAKQSFLTCDVISGSFNGSATITSIGAPIVAIGKVYSGNLSYPALGTAFVGASAGASKLAAPYVRWTQTRFDTNPGNRQRAFIAIQNVGTGQSGPITVKYYDLNGTLIGTHTLVSIGPGQKTNSKPIDATLAAGQTQDKLDEFGYIGGYGGSATIECANSGCQIVAVVRIASANSATNPADIVAEDYNGIPIN